jgi:hypothetical protein
LARAREKRELQKRVEETMASEYREQACDELNDTETRMFYRCSPDLGGAS